MYLEGNPGLDRNIWLGEEDLNIRHEDFGSDKVVDHSRYIVARYNFVSNKNSTRFIPHQFVIIMSFKCASQPKFYPAIPNANAMP